MVQVPPFLLRRLYAKGSLRNTPEGFQFELKNTLGSGFAEGLLPVTVDGEAVPIEDCWFSVQDAPEPSPFRAVTPEKTFTLAMNKTTTIIVRGRQLPQGAHRVGLGFQVVGLGPMSFEVTDGVAGTS